MLYRQLLHESANVRWPNYTSLSNAPTRWRKTETKQKNKSYITFHVKKKYWNHCAPPIAPPHTFN